jgi:ATP-dependent helicase HrpA
MWRGTRALLGVVTASPAPYVRRYLGRSAKLTLTNNPHGGIAALLDDCATCALDAILADGGGPSWTADGFAALAAAAREKLPDLTLDVVNRVEKVLAASRDAERAVSGLRAPALAAAVADVERVRTGLVYPGFVTATGLPRLPDLVRYLRACERRCEALPRDPGRDATRMRDVAEVTAAYDELLTAVGPRRAGDPEIVRIRWMIEELRVSLFAQSLGTAHPVSVERILRAIDSVELTASTLTR